MDLNRKSLRHPIRYKEGKAIKSVHQVPELGVNLLPLFEELERDEEREAQQTLQTE